jgi:hypothetical protein
VTASCWPIWRTNPSGFGLAGYWAYATTLLASCILVFVVGLTLIGVTILASDVATFDVSPRSAEPFIQSIYWSGLILCWSLIAGLVAVPALIMALNRCAASSCAGWSVALSLGIVCGSVVSFGVSIWSGMPACASVPTTFVIIGLLLAYSASVWLSLRLLHPSSLGILNKAPPCPPPHRPVSRFRFYSPSLARRVARNPSAVRVRLAHRPALP